MKSFHQIDRRSYDAYVKSDPPTLDELLCALIVDPLAARDAAEEFGVERTPHALSDFADLGLGPYREALETISQFVRMTENPRIALGQITLYDRKLGTWCAFAVFRRTFAHVETLRMHSVLAMEASEGWVRGTRSEQSAREASKLAIMSSMEHQDVVAAVASRIAWEDEDSIDGQLTDLTNSFFRALFTKPLSVVGANRERAAEAQKTALGEMTTTIAEACLSFPAIP